MAKKNLFNSIKVAVQKSNTFDLTHDVKMSLKMGNLYPCCIMEAVPGDKFRLAAESLLRFAPLVSPVMHRMDVFIHYFFVPHRLTFPEWEEFITGEPGDVIPPTLPIASTQGTGSLANYLGCPLVDNPGFYHVNALPFAAYQRVFWDYYRDQNVSTVTETENQLVPGDNSANTGLYDLRRRAWEHDYFTSALPSPQQGAAVGLPVILDDAPISMKDASFLPADPPFEIEPGAANPGITINAGADVVGSHPLIADNMLFADNSGVQSTTTINDLRRSFRLQEWLEKNARGGRRYIENILNHFGVRSSDARLQRAEYITGVKSPVVISEVLNTTGDTDVADPLPQGNMAGHAISVNSGNYGSYFCEEHGYIIGIMSVMPKTAYQQGIPKHFLKANNLDYFWPSFAHIGEQAIQNKEIFVNSTTPNDTFGYIPRYAEYKFMNNRVAGEFQSSLDFWHLGRIFATEPSLNETFIECLPDDRIFAVQDGTDYLYAHVLNKIFASRKMPVYGTPTF